jgi:fatty acyl-CoA reductase
VVRKGLRRCVDAVTIDQPSFEAALAAVPRGAAVALVPTHRSYMDFLLAPLLFYARPELGLAPPQIAAAVEFSKLPLLGSIFERAGAFFVERGVGRANPKLNQKLRELVATQASMMFFIEGKRSRDRKFITPKTGILRALQAAGSPVAIVPIAISYDRVPEEAALLEELRSGTKAPMRLAPLLRWAVRLAAGQIALGRVHLAAGTPVVLDVNADVPDVAARVMAELQRKTATTTHHLDAFLRRHPLRGVDRAWLAEQIKARGGEVLTSVLPVEDRLELDAEVCLRKNWMHFFYGDAVALFHDHPERLRAIESEHFLRQSASGEALRDPRLVALLHALFDVPREVSFATPQLLVLETPRPRPTA